MSCSSEASTSRGPPGLPILPGKSWDVWLESCVPKDPLEGNRDGKERCGEEGEKTELNVATLPNPKAPCYGACPAQDDFVLVQCSDCGLLLKPIAYSHHQESKHRRQSSSWGSKSQQQGRTRTTSDSKNVINSSDSSYKDSFLLSPIFRDMDPFVDLSHSTLPDEDSGHSCDSTCPPGCLQATVFPSSSSTAPEEDKNIFEQLGSRLQKKRDPPIKSARGCGPKSGAALKSGTARTAPQALNGPKKKNPPLRAKVKSQSATENNGAAKKISSRDPPQRTYMTGSPMSVDEDGSYVVKRSSAGRLTLTISKAAGSEDLPEDDTSTTIPKRGNIAKTPQKSQKSRRKQILELSPGDADLQLLKETRSRISRSKRDGEGRENLDKALTEVSESGINSGSQSPQQSSIGSEKASKPSVVVRRSEAVSGSSTRPTSAILDHAGLARSFFKSTTHPRTPARSFYNGRLVGRSAEENSGSGQRRGNQGFASFNRRAEGVRTAVQLALNPRAAFNGDQSLPTTAAMLKEINQRIRERTVHREKAFSADNSMWDTEIDIDEEEPPVPALSPKTYSPVPHIPTPPYHRGARVPMSETVYASGNHVIKTEMKQEFEPNQGPPPLQFGPSPTTGSLRKLLAKSTAEVIPLSSAKKKALDLQRRRKKPPPIAIHPNSSSFSSTAPGYISNPVSNPGDVHALIPNSHTTTVNINRIIELQQNRHPISLSDVADQQINYQIKKEPRVSSSASWPPPPQLIHSGPRTVRNQPNTGPKEIPLEPVEIGEIKQPVLPPISPLTPTGSSTAPPPPNIRLREMGRQQQPPESSETETIDILEECMQEIQLPSEPSQQPPVNIPLHRPPSGGTTKYFVTPPSTPHQPTPPLSRGHGSTPVSFYEPVGRHTGIQQGFSGQTGNIQHQFAAEVPEEYAFHHQQQHQQMKRPVAQMSGYFSQPKARKRPKPDRSMSGTTSYGSTASTPPAIIIPAVLSSANQHQTTGANRNVSISHIPTNAGASNHWQKAPFRRAETFQHSPTGNQPTATRQVHQGPGIPRTYVTLANNNGPLLLDSSGKFFAVNAQTVSTNGTTAFVLPNKAQNGMVLNRQAGGVRQPTFRGRTAGNSQQPQLVLMDAGCLQKGILQTQGSQEGGNYRLVQSGPHPVHVPGMIRPQSSQQQTQHYHHPGNNNVVIQHHHLPSHGRQISYHGQQGGNGNGTVVINGPLHAGNMSGQSTPVLGSPGNQPPGPSVHPRQQQQFFSPVS